MFVHAGEIWRVGHDGGDAERLTSFPGGASHPRLSPDGTRGAWFSDRSGEYLYFMASTDYGLNTGWLDISPYERETDRELSLAVFDADNPSPLRPESDEEPVGEDEDDSDADEEGENGDVQIGPEGLDQRILSLDVPVSTYSGLYAGPEGTLFFGETGADQPGPQLHRYQLDADEAQPYLNGVTQFAVSHDGQKALYKARGRGTSSRRPAARPSATERSTGRG